MKTAIFNTDFWKDDTVFSLNSDTRQLYLCIITNPERGACPAFKCTDRLLTAYTGYSKELIATCKQQLQDKGLLTFIDDYIILGKNSYIQPTKGKLSMTLYEKEISKLPYNIKDFLLSDSGVAQEYINNNNNKDINNDNNAENNTTFQKEIPETLETNENIEIPEIIKAFESINFDCKKMYGNKTQRKACAELISNFSFERVKMVIEKTLPITNGMEFFPTITTPLELQKKWTSLESAIRKYESKKLLSKSQVAF